MALTNRKPINTSSTQYEAAERARDALRDELRLETLSIPATVKILAERYLAASKKGSKS